LFVNNVVQTRHDVTILQGSGDVGQVAERVEAVAAAVEVAGGHQTKLSLGGRADAESAGIAGLVAGSAALLRGLQVVADDVPDAIAEAQDAGLEGVGGNGARDLLDLVEVAGFVVAEEKRLVFLQ